MSWNGKKPVNCWAYGYLGGGWIFTSGWYIVDIVYIPPPVNELTDEEKIDDDICENEWDLIDVVGTYEIHVSLPDTAEDLDHQVQKKQRYNRKERKMDSIHYPKVIAEYNQHMGGVDLHDNGISNYRIKVRGKKWWWLPFVNFIDSVIVNSWIIYNLANQ